MLEQLTLVSVYHDVCNKAIDGDINAKSKEVAWRNTTGSSCVIESRVSCADQGGTLPHLNFEVSHGEFETSLYQQHERRHSN